MGSGGGVAFGSGMSAVACDLLVVGAGVIGLAVAARLASDHQVILVEAHDGFGRETSSRNSEVIHSGIHYPAASLKTELCLQGQKLLYPFARKHSVPFRECGKLVVATSESEQAKLDAIAVHVRALGVRVEVFTGEQVAEREPALQVHSALYFPETGIIDSHAFMGALEAQVWSRSGLVAYHHKVHSVVKAGENWSATVDSPNGILEIQAARVVNAAGLGAAALSNQVLGTTRYAHRFCRGRYFHLSSAYRNRYRHLVYPVPQTHGLGVHTTLDLEGFVKLGPDVDWCADSDPGELSKYYACDWDALRPTFAQAGRKLIPDLKDADLTPGTIGIRPKLFIDGVAGPDFLIENHQGWIHCLGIESPGLTAALAIGEKVAALA
jgi:2-hydroxyglutarate dehydrogenase